MDGTELATLLVESGGLGWLLPALISVLNQPHWPAWTRGATTLAVCVVAGTVLAAANGQLTGVGIPAAVLAVFLSSQGFYHRWYKTRSGNLTQAIEDATSARRAQASARHAEPRP